MSALWPSAAESASLQLTLPGLGGLRARALLAVGLFALGLAGWSLLPFPFNLPGLALVLGGHLPLWVKRQTTAPGGATPAHEEIWAPVEAEWLSRVQELERRGERWDTTPWDLSNRLGCATLGLVLLLLGGGAIWLGVRFDYDALFRVGLAAPLLFVPLWLNGMRSNWNPSELRKKGEALAVAREEAERLGRGELDAVPLLALREGARGKYPVDARLMLRPVQEDESGFLGVQLQVALNNVQGTDYPYLYAVILTRGEAAPRAPKRQTVGSGETRLVFEPGEGGGVRYLVVRQHADNSGGWHTKPQQIRDILEAALDLARATWRAGGGDSKGAK